MVNQLVLLAAWTTWAKPLWIVAVVAIIGIVALFAILTLIRLLVPKLSAICWGTAKEALSQPLFYVLLAFGAFTILILPVIPYYTFGEDVKMVKEAGLTIIMILSIVLAVWTASVSVSEEIEGRTALTVLSKPIRRWHFILGKFAGIVVPVAIMFIVLGSLFLGTVSFKVVYDARENSQPEPSWQQCAFEMQKIVPGLGLAFMEAVVMASISVAISTRLAMLPNLVICGSIYALGHLGAHAGELGGGPARICALRGQPVGHGAPHARTFHRLRSDFHRRNDFLGIRRLGRTILPALQHPGHALRATAVRGTRLGIDALLNPTSRLCTILSIWLAERRCHHVFFVGNIQAIGNSDKNNRHQKRRQIAQQNGDPHKGKHETKIHRVARIFV